MFFGSVLNNTTKVFFSFYQQNEFLFHSSIFFIFWNEKLIFYPKKKSELNLYRFLINPKMKVLHFALKFWHEKLTCWKNGWYIIISMYKIVNIPLFFKAELFCANVRYTFLSNHYIHKSLCGLCFWAWNPLIERFY